MSQDFKRDDGSKITVEYELEEAGEPHGDCPGSPADGGGSGPVYAITAAYNEAGEEIQLTERERDRMETWLAENVEQDYSDDLYMEGE